MSIEFSNKSFVITGTFKEFERKEIEEIITSKGGVIKSSVSSKTDYLICGEKAGSKLAKAEELGITIISEEEFKNSLNNGENQMSENELKEIIKKAAKFGRGKGGTIKSLSELKEMFNLDKHTVLLDDIYFRSIEYEYQKYDENSANLLFISRKDFESELELLGIKNKEDFSKIDDRVTFFNKLYPKIENIMENNLNNLTKFLKDVVENCDWEFTDGNDLIYRGGELCLRLPYNDRDLEFKLNEFQNPKLELFDGIYKVRESDAALTEEYGELPDSLNEFLDLLTVDDEYLNTNDFIHICSERLGCDFINGDDTIIEYRNCIIIDSKEYNEYNDIESIDEFITLLKTQQSKNLDIDTNLSDEIFDKFCENHRDLIEKAYKLVQSFLNGEDFEED